MARISLQSTGNKDLDPGIFPFNAWEFEDPERTAAPKLTLRSPWKLELEGDLALSGDLDVTGAIVGSTAEFTGLVKAETLESTVAIVGSTAEFTGLVKAETFESTVATGTAPIVVASATEVANLNAAKLNNYSAVDLIGLGGLRNLFLNGRLDIWQRGTSAVVSTAWSTSLYQADKWKVSVGGTSASTTYSRQAFTVGQTTVPGNPQYYARSACANGGDSTNGYHIFGQFVEDVSILSATTVTLSFWAKADAVETVHLELGQAFGSGGSPSAEVNTPIARFTLSTSWQLFTATFTTPSISGKTIGSTGIHTSCTVIRLWMSGGSAFNARLGSALGTHAGTFDFALLQLERGSVVTAFEHRPISSELALCQRYYEKTYDLSVVPGTAVDAAAQKVTAQATVSYLTIPWEFKTRKRTNAGTPYLWGTTGTANRITSDGVDKTASAAGYNESGIMARISNVNVGVNTFNGCHMAYDADF